METSGCSKIIDFWHQRYLKIRDFLYQRFRKIPPTEILIRKLKMETSGFEPEAPALQGRCSTGLSYVPNIVLYKLKFL